MVLKILSADPRYLRHIGTGVDLNGNAFTGTILQAALHTTDIELCGKIKPYFDQIENGQGVWDNQVREIYTQSLAHYQNTLLPTALNKLEAEQLQLSQRPNGLNETQTKRYKNIDEKIKEIKRSIIACKTALKNKNEAIQTIIEAHDQAQEAYAFDFEPYANAICAIDLNHSVQRQLLDDVMELIYAETPAETAAAIAKTGGFSPIQTDAARAKSFNQLTPVEKLNRFREAYCAHIKPEIIANSYHILAGLKINDAVWDDYYKGRFTDPECEKLSVIFSQLVGWAQRNAAEPVRQDIRQGTYYLTEEKKPRTRQSRYNSFNYYKDESVRDSDIDVSLVDSSSVDGIGYKIACNWRWGDVPVWSARCDSPAFFKTYGEQKQRTWKTYVPCEITSTTQLLGDVR